VSEAVCGGVGMQPSATEPCLQAGPLTHALPVPRTSLSVANVPETQVWNLDFSFSRLCGPVGVKEEPSQAFLLGWSWGGLPLPLHGPSQTSLSVPPLLHPEPFLGVVVPLILLGPLTEVGMYCTQPSHFLPLCRSLSPESAWGFSWAASVCQDGVGRARPVLGGGL